MSKPRTILVTFAGRRDRMRLLTQYVREAISRGLIDEWHVWMFARNEADRKWLREQFPVAQATPNASNDYFRLPKPFSMPNGEGRLSFSVRAAHDVHVSLRRLSGQGPSFEIVLGGWNNQFSALRKFANPGAIEDQGLRDPSKIADIAAPTPGLLPEFGFSNVDICAGPRGLEVAFAGKTILHDPEPIAPGSFEILYRTGYGANGDWSFDGFSEFPARLFVTGPEAHFPPSALFYNQAYQYYAANAETYSNDVILKCDDDIVYIDLNKLGEFIQFRRANTRYFLISANVVNNGVCAHMQQNFGAIPRDVMTCELPPGGMCGSLWDSGAKAETLHRLFLHNPHAFFQSGPEVLWNERVSINFIALLGRDLVHIPDVTSDDEHDLCYGVRKRAKKQNCIYPGFVVSHLSFYKQDSEMNIDLILRGYEEIANELGRPLSEQATVDAYTPKSKEVAA